MAAESSWRRVTPRQAEGVASSCSALTIKPAGDGVYTHMPVPGRALAVASWTIESRQEEGSRR